MKSEQYEEFCRKWVADTKGMPLSDIHSGDLPGLHIDKTYKNQIDLWWDEGDNLTRIITIANAKWRGTQKVDQPDVMLLEKVKEDTASHKAVMITNYGFTEGAKTYAEQKGIALHIVSPSQHFQLSRKDRGLIQNELHGYAQHGQPLWTHKIENRNDQRHNGYETR